MIEFLLLGSMELRRQDGSSVLAVLAQPKRAALLAYLALAEPQGFHRRDTLLRYFWPESDEKHARGALNKALHFLRRSLGEELIPSRGSEEVGLAWDRVWCGCRAFQVAASKGAWAEALELYRGDLLEGFHLSGCPDFEHWLREGRGRLREMAAGAAWGLAHEQIQEGELTEAERTAQRALGLVCTDESEVRRFIESLAAAGDRAAAVRFFERFEGKLWEELELEPSVQTKALGLAIRRLAEVHEADPDLGPETATPGPPPWEEEPSREARSETQVFVGRRGELDSLFDWLRAASRGSGRVGFVTGEAGCGKTALAREFCRRAVDLDPEVVAATGRCNAYTGTGDPHYPFREILGLLSGDVEAEWTVGALRAEDASRLWNLFPSTVAACIEGGPDLVGTFILEADLIARCRRHPALGERAVKNLRRMLRERSKTSALEEKDLFEQFVRVLKSLARDRTLILVIDDLQWSDSGSVGLLFHLARKLAGVRILVLGLFRPAEVALGRGGERHPLEPALNEIKASFGDIEMELGASGGREFVNALIDSEPNALGEPFRDALLKQTGGHALYTVELLRSLQEQGLLNRDEADQWVEGPGLQWDILPAKVGAVIGERIGRLSRPLQELLATASVEGEDFTLEAVAQVRGRRFTEALGDVGEELEKRHRLVIAVGSRHVAGQRMSTYRFRHILFQRYLYDRLDEVERGFLHEQVGGALEQLHGKHADEFALRIGHHFREAGLWEKAADYFFKAGQQAERSLAHGDALTHYESALKDLLTLPRSEDRDRRELAHQLAVARARRSVLAPGITEACDRAFELAERLGTPQQLFWASHGLFYVGLYGGDWEKSERFAHRCLSVARDLSDPVLLVQGLACAGLDAMYRGVLDEAAGYLDELIRLYDPDRHWTPTFFGLDVGVFARSLLGMTRWEMGYAEQAVRLFNEAASLARQTEDPGTLHLVLFRDTLMRMCGGDIPTARAKCEEALAAMEEYGRTGTVGPMLPTYRGWCDVLLGRTHEGIADIERGLREWEAGGNRIGTARMWSRLARALTMVDRGEEGLIVIEAAMSDPLRNEPAGQADVQRNYGEVLLALPRPDAAGAEAAFRRAMEIARGQGAKSFELLAATSLARLLRSQGRLDEARESLNGVYGWFTEGHDWPYLMDARGLLEELGEEL